MQSTNAYKAIENIVLERAKTLDLDVSDPADKPAFLGLITRAVSAHNVANAGKPQQFSDVTAAESRIARNLMGAGPLESLLDDDNVWEIMINAPDEIFVKRHDGPSGYHDDVFHDDAHVERIIARLMDRSGQGSRTLDPAKGIQDAQLAGGSRMHVIHREVGGRHHMMVNIRKFTGLPFNSLDELVSRRTLTADAAMTLTRAARAGMTVLFAGAPGSGKTTILGCTAAALDPATRIVTAEEVFELSIPLPNVAAMQTREARSDRPAIDLRQLVAAFLRMAPDRAVVGEVRDREALPLLLTLSSGVPGFATIHAGSARAALDRLRLLCQLAESSSELGLRALTQLVANSIGIVVYMERTAAGPQVHEIVAVEDSASSAGEVFTTTALFTRDARGTLQASGARSERLQRAFAKAPRSAPRTAPQRRAA